MKKLNPLDNLKYSILKDNYLFNCIGKKQSKEFKWLEYIADMFQFNETFIKKFHFEVTKLFENYIGKKINWSKLWLFIPPSYDDKSLKECLDLKENKTFYILESAFKLFNHFEISLYIIWWDKKGRGKIDFTKDISHLDLVFELHPMFEYTQEDFDKMPNYSPYEKPKKLNYAVSFPVETYCEDIPHEAILSIKFKDNIIDIDAVQKYFGLAQHVWNESTESGKENRGYIHNIYYDRMEDESYKWYLDHGSSKGNVVEYLLKILDSTLSNIAKVEIENI